ncbi:hypothetical protein LTR09_011940 [Extremus antarcticus]|uniref:Xylanolytic transcriptional activator regulatory domain-containing protein n=1 Tax=Extremus antarcticus TaxID=702011 RepID=A0AAJ0G4P8_9PEZI|nr:hypothetical protein LTR09_011940 [Extremus antarcticus]
MDFHDPQADTGATSGHTNGNTSPPSQKRQRAKQACEPCRLRKRRCDSAMPCNIKIVEANTVNDLERHPEAYVHHEVAPEDRTSVEDASTLRQMEANSGIAFTGLLGRRLDPGQGLKLFTFGWNLGGGSAGGQGSSSAVRMDLAEWVNHDQMVVLAGLYFANVDPLYGFLDKDSIFEQIDVRWTQPEACTLPDYLLAGLVAGGGLFSDGSLDSVMPALVDAAKQDMDARLTQLPTLTDAQSWLLRCLYLRATEHPHAVHMASAILMHIVEALGIHQESRGTPNVPDGNADSIENRRRTFWIARMLNTWVSFEYGRTRVHLRGINAQLPTPREGDFTTEYIQLYSISCCLDPERDDSKWEDFLRQLEAYKCHHDAIEMSKVNIAMGGYRRLRLANPTLSPETTQRIIKLGLEGLEAARRMAAKHMPWWHVGNVPFQVVCVFLAMDVRESLSHVGTAVKVLEEVVERFKTGAMREALKTARFLVRLAKKRKDEDSDVLGLSLKKDNAEAVPLNTAQQDGVKISTVHDVINGTGGAMGGMAIPMSETPNTVSSSEDWSLDLLNNSDLDWNFFLTADMPTFDGGFVAPDGLM